MGGCLYTVVDAEDVVAIVLTVVPVLQAPHHQSGVGTFAAQNIPTSNRAGGPHIGVVLNDFRHLLHRLLCLCQCRTRWCGNVDKNNACVLVGYQTSRGAIEHPGQQDDANSSQHTYEPAATDEPAHSPTVFS